MRLTAALLVTLLAARALPAQQPPAKFGVARFTFHQGEDGPPLPRGYRYVSGEPLYLSFRVSGYKVVKNRVDLRWQLIATDPDGLLLFEPVSGAVREEVSSADENWLPRVQKTLTLPPILPTGVYQLKLRVADELAAAAAEDVFEFNVRGLDLPPPGEIAIANLKFYREENGRFPAEPPLFSAGATVWIRFELGAFALGEKNRFHVEYGVRILRPSGKVLFEQDPAAAEQDAPFYPKRQMRSEFSITTTPDLSPGEYTVLVQARDRVSGKSAEAKAVFQIQK